MRLLSKTTLIVAALCLCMSLGGCVKGTAPSPGHVSVGEGLPAFSVITLDGETVTSGQLARQPALVVLFSVTCPDCRAELPHVQQFFSQSEGVASVLAVARDDSPDAVRSYWKKNNFTIPVAAPGDRSVYDLFDRGSGSGVPQLYLTDSGGKVVFYGDDSTVITSEILLSILTSL